MDFILILVYLTVTLLGQAKADFIGGINLDATGCLFGNLQSTPGFNARFYAYSVFDSADLSHSQYYANSYLTGYPTTSASGITNPVISNSVPFTWKTHKGLVYGATVKITNFLLELTGYFLGKHIFFIYIQKVLSNILTITNLFYKLMKPVFTSFI